MKTDPEDTFVKGPRESSNGHDLTGIIRSATAALLFRKRLA